MHDYIPTNEAEKIQWMANLEERSGKSEGRRAKDEERRTKSEGRRAKNKGWMMKHRPVSVFSFRTSLF